MRDREKSIKTLVDLGLSRTQAKIYLALVEKGISTIRAAADNSGVGRPDTYRAMLELKRVGLIETILCSPTKYNPLPLPEAVSILIGQKHKEIRDLKEKTGKLLEEYENKISEQPDVCDNEFILIPKGKASINKGMTAILSAQESIDCITSFKKFSQTLLIASEEIIKAANRGVKIRFILDKSSGKTLLKILPELDNASCQIKYFEELPVSFLAVYDGCETQMATSSDGHFSQASMLWSDNLMLLRVFQDYFESLWCSKIEKPFEEKTANYT